MRAREWHGLGVLYTIYGTQYEFLLLDTAQGSKTGCDALSLPFPIADDIVIM